MGTMLMDLTFGLALVLVLRRPARRIFGAGPAFTLWLLPPLLALLPWLPLAAPEWIGTSLTRVIPAPATKLFAQGSASGTGQPWPMLLWLGGVAFAVLRLLIHYMRLRGQSLPLPDMLRQAVRDSGMATDLGRLRMNPAGPAVLWAPRSQLLLPADFLERFDPDQRRMVLLHEFTHLRRGDAAWSALADVALALLWFHPLAWLASSRLRLDQELACDERVLRQHPQDEARYAHTLLHSTGMDLMPALIPWLAQPQLKERLRMIQSHRPGALRRRTGFVVLAMVMASGACVVQAASRHAQPAQDQPATATTFKVGTAPHYPESAVKKHERGTVVLDILVGIDGRPISFTVNQATRASPDLVKAASDAAMQWHFNPETKNGQPIQSYARVPVNFDISDAPKTATAGGKPKSA